MKCIKCDIAQTDMRTIIVLGRPFEICEVCIDAVCAEFILRKVIISTMVAVAQAPEFDSLIAENITMQEMVRTRDEKCPACGQQVKP